jgi:hypothetical protein
MWGEPAELSDEAIAGGNSLITDASMGLLKPRFAGHQHPH